ncbi:Brix domain-domain-containing protein [Kockovaella imperatae]|uniref:Ribosome production factor 2 homolog n=1 Tax=Kockovaella imperatae TaxID=4999 RepID=A0A1Y1UP32_9TREE|nr:Brix domain-domain-containing protein [Kockovaella imperatae]ORX39307.1 Brix domain-domain-containing protein [Kockovaella imperatae]
MSMLRTIKPKNARVKRALEKREPQIEEGDKTAIFVRGNSTSERVRLAMQDLYALKRPHAISFSRKNDIHPFEDASSLEFFSGKNDASLFLTGLHSKKRPHDLIFTRMFDGKVLDMIELGIEEIKSIKEFESPKSSVGARPLVVFHSDLFDTHPTYQLLKSILLDFFGGKAVSEVPVTAVEHVISITAGPLASSSSASDSASLPHVHFRVYTMKALPSGGGKPRAELVEMGPSLDLSVRRVQEANEDTWKMATKRPKVAKKDVEKGLGKKRKNIETDEMGDKVGRIHLEKQDLGKLQSRKVKAFKTGKGSAKVQED